VYLAAQDVEQNQLIETRLTRIRRAPKPSTGPRSSTVRGDPNAQFGFTQGAGYKGLGQKYCPAAYVVCPGLTCGMARKTVCWRCGITAGFGLRRPERPKGANTTRKRGQLESNRSSNDFLQFTSGICCSVGGYFRRFPSNWPHGN